MTFPLCPLLFKNQFIAAPAESFKAGPIRISQPFGATDYHVGRTAAQKKKKKKKIEN